MKKKMLIYNYIKELDNWNIISIIRFDDFDEDGFEGLSMGLVSNTGHNDYPTQVYVGTIFKHKNMKISIKEGREEEIVIFEDKEGETYARLFKD